MKNNEYEIEKQKNKQKLVRNEFLYFNQSQGKFDFPIIKKQNIDVNSIYFLSYCDAELNDEQNKNKTLHFFTYDWLFEKVYTKAEDEIEKLSQYRYLLSPDFSIFTNMPRALQIESIFKNRWCGAFWQSKGLEVIPTVSWGDPSSFDFCFDGIEQGSVVTVSTYYRENLETDFMIGYNEMLKRINPSVVICYDEPFASMQGNVKEFLPTTYEWTKNLSPKDLKQFKWEKRNRNVSGLNKADFKYFDYDDPLAKNIPVTCSICGKTAYIAKYGNGECPLCGWKFSADESEFEKNYGITYPMLVSVKTAREQYKNGLPFKATFDEFVRGLYFYAEMLFKYNGVWYNVFLENDGILFGCKNFKAKFLDAEDFMKNAEIDGTPLKDLWNDVSFSGFMDCSITEND